MVILYLRGYQKYCAFVLNRFEVGADGKTAYERMKGKKAKQQGVEFAEGILFKKKRVNQPKDVSVWEDGIYLGVRGMSGEIIVGTKSGVWKTRTIQRKPHEYRWCQSNVEMVGGVPWNTNAGDKGEDPDGDIPKVVINLDHRREGEKDAEKIKESFEVPRSFAITKADLEKHEYSTRCAGCRSVLRKTARQGHSVECRERLRQEMSRESKVIEAEDREMELPRKSVCRHE